MTKRRLQGGPPSLLTRLLIGACAFATLLVLYEIEQSNMVLEMRSKHQDHMAAIRRQVSSLMLEGQVDKPDIAAPNVNPQGPMASDALHQQPDIERRAKSPAGNGPAMQDIGLNAIEQRIMKPAAKDTGSGASQGNAQPAGNGNQPLQPIKLNNATARTAVAGLPRALKDKCLASHKDMPGCENNGTLPILITGVGRSGTHHTENVLRKKGIKVCHERVCEQGAVSWTYAVVDPNKFYPWEFASNRIKGQRFKRIFHQVRHPLKTISSLTTFESLSWRFIAKHTPCVDHLENVEPPLRRALIHWVTWNRMVEANADWTYRMEDTSVDEICQRAGFPDENCKRAVARGHKDQRTHVTTTWAELEALDADFAREARLLAHHYGYEDALEQDPDDYDDVD